MLRYGDSNAELKSLECLVCWLADISIHVFCIHLISFNRLQKSIFIQTSVIQIPCIVGISFTLFK